MTVSLGWFWRRLTVMSLREIVAVRAWRALRDRLPLPPPAIPAGLRLKVPALNPAHAEAFRARFPAAEDALIAEADGILAGRITLFGVETRCGDPPDWHLDIRTGHRCPLVPSRRLDYRDVRQGDPKDVWELNRMHFLPTLGAAYFLTDEKHYADRALDLILSWIKANPPHMGINWTSGIEMSLRILAWVETLRFLGDRFPRDPEEEKLVAAAIYRQGRHIARNLSLYSSANNHLINELTGLACAGRVLGLMQWEDEAFNLLCTEVGRQIQDDGAGAEQSPCYQLQTTALYLMAARNFDPGGRNFPAEVVGRLSDSAIFLRSLAGGDGELPQIGDDDSGEMFFLGAGQPDFKTAVFLAAALGYRSDLLYDDAERDQAAWWFLGPERFTALLKAPGRGTFVERRDFPEGGLTILERKSARGRLRAVFDAGPQGLRPMASHGHADALNVLLYLDGVPVLIDPGTYVYLKSDFWRDYFRGTAAHNTIRVSGLDQSVFGGPFLTLRPTDAVRTAYEPDRMAMGFHEGYCRFNPPLTHRRTVELTEDPLRCVITDVLETGTPGHFFEQFFHFDGEAAVVPCPGRSGEFSVAAAGVHLKVTIEPGLETALYIAADARPAGRRSRVMGKLENAVTLIARGRVDGLRVLRTVFEPA